jgi:hypothetical protein
MSRRYQRKRFPSPQAQLSLPLDYSQSESDALSRNHAPLKRKRWRRWQDALATSPTIPVRHGIVQASCPLDTNKFRQRQQFLLTPTLSTLINNVNGNRWRSNVSALPPFTRRTFAKPSESRAHVRRGSPRCLPANPLGRYQRRARLPALPMQCCL